MFYKKDIESILKSLSRKLCTFIFRYSISNIAEKYHRAESLDFRGEFLNFLFRESRALGQSERTGGTTGSAKLLLVILRSNFVRRNPSLIRHAPFIRNLVQGTIYPSMRSSRAQFGTRTSRPTTPQQGKPRCNFTYFLFKQIFVGLMINSHATYRKQKFRRRVFRSFDENFSPTMFLYRTDSLRGKY